MLPAFIPGLVLAARGRARSWRSSSTQARIIGKSSTARGRVTFPPFSCDCPITPIGDRARAIVLEFADRGLTGRISLLATSRALTAPRVPAPTVAAHRAPGQASVARITDIRLCGSNFIPSRRGDRCGARNQFVCRLIANDGDRDLPPRFDPARSIRVRMPSSVASPRGDPSNSQQRRSMLDIRLDRNCNDIGRCPARGFAMHPELSRLPRHSGSPGCAR